MQRLICVLSLLVLACLFSGTFGVLHNQVSYSVSAEYFTKFKFQQFEISNSESGRYGAAIVGWQASWWMGLIIGGILIPIGLLIRNNSDLVYWMLRTFLIVFFTTACFSVAALTLGYYLMPDENSVEFVFRGSRITDPARFQVAGLMHQSSYLGGLVSIFVGAYSILRRFLFLETGDHKI